MTDELIKQQIAALLEERRGYEARVVDQPTLQTRIEAVDASLRQLGWKPPSKKVT